MISAHFQDLEYYLEVIRIPESVLGCRTREAELHSAGKVGLGAEIVGVVSVR